MLFIFVLVLSGFDLTLGSCFKDILLKTQDCSNNRVVYYSMEGEFSGFGSEFFYYFVHALKDAVLVNARLKYVITRKAWENDCPGDLMVGLISLS